MKNRSSHQGCTCNCKFVLVSAVLSVTAGGKEWTRLRREVGIPSVTSHQRRRTVSVTSVSSAGSVLFSRHGSSRGLSRLRLVVHMAHPEGSPDYDLWSTWLIQRALQTTTCGPHGSSRGLSRLRQDSSQQLDVASFAIFRGFCERQGCIGEAGPVATGKRRSRVGLCSPRRSAWNTKMSRRCTAQGCPDLVSGQSQPWLTRIGCRSRRESLLKNRTENFPARLTHSIVAGHMPVSVLLEISRVQSRIRLR
jgi:hypothetical protein